MGCGASGGTYNLQGDASQVVGWTEVKATEGDLDVEPLSPYSKGSFDLNLEPLSPQSQVSRTSSLRSGALALRRIGANLFSEDYEDHGEVFTGSKRVKHRKTRQVQSARAICKEKRSLESIEAEVNLFRKLDCIGIAKVLEVYDDSLNYYLIFGSPQLGCLASFMEGRGSKPLGQNACADLIKQLMRAVAYMHGQSVSHRGIRPEALCLMEAEGGESLEDCKLRVADLSSAVACQEGKKMTGMVGAPNYSSPQMVLKDTYTRLCDVWSTGAILHLLMIGEPPVYRQLKDVYREQEAGDESASRHTDNKVDNDFTERVRTGLIDERPWKKLPSQASPLLRGMLLSNEEHRCSCHTALRSPWCEHHGKEQPKLALTRWELESMVNYSKMNLLQKTVLSIIARRLPEKDVDPLQVIFESMDVDQDGVLSFHEFDVALRKLQNKQIHSWRVDQACRVYPSTQELMEHIDGNGNLELEFMEFVAAAMPRQCYTKAGMLKTAFEAMDVDGNGEITLDQLLDQLSIDRRYATEKDQQMLVDVITAADLDGNGIIDFEEFEVMMKSTMGQLQERQELALVKQQKKRWFACFGSGRTKAQPLRASKKSHRSSSGRSRR